MKDLLRKRRLELGLTLEEVGNYCNVGKSTVRKWEVGLIKNMKRNQISKLSEVLRISPIDIINAEISDTSELTPIKKVIYDDYFPLHYISNLSAGSFDELLETEPDAVVYVPIKFQTKKKRLLAFKINGTSMNNVIQDGSIVVVEHNNDLPISDGTVVVVYMEGQTTVKRLYDQGDRITLMPDSSDKAHMPITIIKEEKQVYIVGRVLWHCNPDDIERYY